MKMQKKRAVPLGTYSEVKSDKLFHSLCKKATGALKVSMHLVLPGGLKKH